MEFESIRSAYQRLYNIYAFEQVILINLSAGWPKI